MSYAILAFAVLFIIFTIIFEIYNSYKTGSWKKINSRKRTQRYIKDKIVLDNKHCNDLPRFDSRGIYGGISGSFTDRTGKFSPSYKKGLDELNKKYGITDK